MSATTPDAPSVRGETTAEAQQQEAEFDRQCERAADALAEADVLLLVTGAGWSADSGLAVYADVANVPAYCQRGLEYADVCQPKWIDADPELFYGFWGQCFNDYRATAPHEGYDIIARWRDDKNEAGGGRVASDIRTRIQRKVESQRPFHAEETQLHTPYNVEGGPAGAFFSFTSNADAHFYDKFEAREIHDCHGNIEMWQCSNRDCLSGIWRAPVQHTFMVDKQTMLAPSKKTTKRDEDSEVIPVEQRLPSIHDDPSASLPRIGQTNGRGQRMEALRNMPASKDHRGWYLEDPSSNWPKCGYCQSLARPAIFMFGDFGWKYDMSQSIRWDLWRETVIEIGQDMKVCIVEVGCGLRVATCRSKSEQMVTDLLEKDGNAKLVRINPDFPSSRDQAVAENLVPIMSRGLRAIKRIDEIYLEKYGGPQESSGYSTEI